MGIAIVLAGGRGSRLGGAKAAAAARRTAADRARARRGARRRARAGRRREGRLRAAAAGLPRRDRARRPASPAVRDRGGAAGDRGAGASSSAPADMPFVTGELLAWLVGSGRAVCGRRRRRPAAAAARALQRVAAAMPCEAQLADGGADARGRAGAGRAVLAEAELEPFGDPARLLREHQHPGRARGRRRVGWSDGGPDPPLRPAARARRRGVHRRRAARRGDGRRCAARARAAARRSASCSRACRCGWRSTASSPAPSTTLHAGDELALLPPVSGGGGPHVRVTEEPIVAARVTDLVRRPSAGAIVTFEGDGSRRRVPRLRGLPRDGRGADGADRRRVRRAPRARRRRPPSTASGVSRSASRASSSRSPRPTARRPSPGAREIIDRDQGAGADLEARARRRRGALGARGDDGRAIVSEGA